MAPSPPPVFVTEIDDNRILRIRNLQEPMSSDTMEFISNASALSGILPIISITPLKIAYPGLLELRLVKFSVDKLKNEIAASLIKNIETSMHNLHKNGIAPGIIDIHHMSYKKNSKGRVTALLIVDETIHKITPRTNVNLDEFLLAPKLLDVFEHHGNSGINELINHGLKCLDEFNQLIITSN